MPQRHATSALTEGVDPNRQVLVNVNANQLLKAIQAEYTGIP
jgi:hypothetical protein